MSNTQRVLTINYLYDSKEYLFNFDVSNHSDNKRLHKLLVWLTIHGVEFDGVPCFTNELHAIYEDVYGERNV